MVEKFCHMMIWNLVSSLKNWSKGQRKTQVTTTGLLIFKVELIEETIRVEESQGPNQGENSIFIIVIRRFTREESALKERRSQIISMILEMHL